LSVKKNLQGQSRGTPRHDPGNQKENSPPARGVAAEGSGNDRQQVPSD